ncbi:ester cyclase [Actinomadura parmotrematis]|uniref:Ester cyclase n=1 Tax=Actinomadura parmotrematis TaxID=2864039 RepID=A0ABS7G4N9_9ACTN|nr:nuclear transport factor 2 family protein [Actinomadura parmotrematis]MBW8487694.1 ester cyclase [Actinomadura parmotrematis]
MTTAPDARAAARRMYAAFNARDYDAVAAVFTPGFRSHPLGTTGPAAVAAAWRRFHDAHPDAQVVVESLVVEDGTVAARTTVRGVRDSAEPPTMLEMFRVENGRIAELWGLSSLARR